MGRISLSCSPRAAVDRGCAMGLALSASQQLQVPSEITEERPWAEVACMGVKMLLLAEAGARKADVAAEESREASMSLSTMKDNLENSTARREQLIKECEEAQLEVAKQISTLQATLEAERRQRDTEFASLMAKERLEFEVKLAALAADKEALTKDLGARDTELATLREEKTSLEDELKAAAYRRGDYKKALRGARKEVRALKASLKHFASSEAGQELIAKASLDSLVLAKRKLDQEYPDVVVDFPDLVNFVIEEMHNEQEEAAEDDAAPTGSREAPSPQESDTSMEDASSKAE
ncbi:unnamed protein product [Linum trigynum]|uniref:Uncharacterized protein n=1 Tax=Linum trigynum TaxID=586398 RepID=A0AAV2CWN7_9ROSI